MVSRVFYEPRRMALQQLGYLKTEDLQRYVAEMENIKEQAVAFNYDPAKWEIELAYAHREQQQRETVAARHQVYLDALRQEELVFLQEEALLQFGDFDNFRQPKQQR